MSLDENVSSSEGVLFRIRAKLSLLANCYRVHCLSSGLETETTDQTIYVCGSAFRVARDPISLSERPLVVVIGYDQTMAGHYALIVSLGVPGVGYQVVWLDAVKEDRSLDRILEETTVERIQNRLDPALRLYLEPVNPKHWSPRDPGQAP